MVFVEICDIAIVLTATTSAPAIGQIGLLENSLTASYAYDAWNRQVEAAAEQKKLYQQS